MLVIVTPGLGMFCIGYIEFLHSPGTMVNTILSGDVFDTLLLICIVVSLGKISHFR